MSTIQQSLRYGAALIALRLAAGSPEQMDRPSSPDRRPSARCLIATVLATLSQ